MKKLYRAFINKFDKDAGYFSLNNVFWFWALITMPIMLIVALSVHFFVLPKYERVREEERLENRKNFIEDVSFSKQLVIGKKEVGDYSKSYLIEYQDTFILEKEDDFVEELYKAVEKGDIVEKKKGADYYIVTRDDSTFNVKF
jgi:hypothetical protein